MKLVLFGVALIHTTHQASSFAFLGLTKNHQTSLKNNLPKDLKSCHDARTSAPIPVSVGMHVHTKRAAPLYAEKKTKGVYARPSAAIEKGSGFYVPGLEGSRVRILFGILVLVLSYVNTLLGLGDSSVEAVEFSGKLVNFYGILLLIQGALEFGKENGLGLDDTFGKEKLGSKAANAAVSASAASAKQLDQMIQGGLREDASMVDNIRWVAASYVSLTVATNVLFLDEDEGVLYSLGGAFNSDDVEDSAIQAAIDTVYQSKGGRVSVPETHPCAYLLPEESRRCVLLQQVEIDGRRKCLMVGSNQLLAAFTKTDLKWLGSLGDYLR